MTAQPIEQPAKLPRIPKTPRGIRAALPAEARAHFDADLAEVDLTDFTAVARIRDKWWARAMYETNPQVQADFEALRRGELELVPSPFKR